MECNKTLSFYDYKFWLKITFKTLDVIIINEL